MREIILSRGRVAMVDDGDYKHLSQWKWSYMKSDRTENEYATRSANGATIRMHRVILNVPPNLQVDHINHNGLDNQRRNLRIVTAFQNAQNARRRKDNLSGYKGVFYFKSDQGQHYLKIPGFLC